MRHILGDVTAELAAGRPVVLATILSSEGSAPRGIGAGMAVLADGSQRGTIGGGSVEYEAARRARTLFEARGSCVETYLLHPNEVADLGRICGGRVHVLFEHLAPDAPTRELFSALAERAKRGQPAFLVRAIENDAVTDMGMFDGESLLFAKRIAREEIGELTASRAVLTEGATQLLIEPVGATSRVYLFGGGHVSQKLVPVLAYVDFRVVVLEDRPEFAEAALLPSAEDVRLCAFDNIAPAAPVSKDDYIVIMTRGHMADYEILRQALRTDATYIGCIGSRHKIALTKQRLVADGFSETDFARVHTPIGLPILAETPEEIAISVCAEMIAHRARH